MRVDHYEDKGQSVIYKDKCGNEEIVYHYAEYLFDNIVRCMSVRILAYVALDMN